MIAGQRSSLRGQSMIPNELTFSCLAANLRVEHQKVFQLIELCLQLFGFYGPLQTMRFDAETLPKSSETKFTGCLQILCTFLFEKYKLSL